MNLALSTAVVCAVPLTGALLVLAVALVWIELRRSLSLRTFRVGGLRFVEASNGRRRFVGSFCLTNSRRTAA